MKAYKLVKNNLSSITVGSGNFRNSFTVYYDIDKVVEPSIRGSYLFVFKKEQDARTFMREHGYYLGSSCRLFECEVPNLFKIQSMSSSQGESALEFFWDRKKIHKKPLYSCLPPKGSFGTHSVKLTKEIKA